MRKFHTLVICIFICALVGGLDADGFKDLNYNMENWNPGTGKPVTTSLNRGRMREDYIHPTTHESQWKYDVTRGPATRPVGSTANPLFEEVLQRSFEQAKPVFHFNKISPENCTSVATDNCGILTGKAFSDNCAPTNPLFTYCQAGAGDFEAKYFLQRIGRLNASRGVILTLSGERGVTKEMFQPVADILVVLQFVKFHQMSVAIFSAAAIRLPILRVLQFYNCTGIVLQRGDFLPFPSLRMVQFLKSSTIASIEDNAFEPLMYLRHITFEHGFDTSSNLSPELKSHLSLLHCSREYKWLRDWLQLRPYLIAPKNAGAVFNLGGFQNMKREKGSIFIPVDCATPRLIADNIDGPFSSLMEM
ncbi:hypothetical protein BV898_13386 [Hypsibius exemplaris]|uniref:Uncharacterized protein n=1 Tax=Hypsibius exemplaris TaxID=2072580 RepID=A0A1W0WB03_HYPEX|nr:hypothetical protein BV898_13386 [Hypsibius exemplaris]